MQKFGPHEALGTKWWIEFFVPVDDSVYQRLIAVISEFEANYSRFKENSLVGCLNKTGQIQGDTKDLPDMLLYGQKLYQASDGVFNILTAGRQVLAGYGKSSSVRERVEVEANPLSDLIIGETILLKRGAVDLGGFGKGWLIDKLKEELLGLGISHFLINGGGDIYATCLSDGAPVDVYLEHPTEAGVYLAKVPLLNQALAVSSSLKRNWHKDNQEFNHLHVEKGVAAHVVADTALEADVAATILCLDTNYAAEADYLIWQEGRISYSKAFESWLFK